MILFMVLYLFFKLALKEIQLRKVIILKIVVLILV